MTEASFIALVLSLCTKTNDLNYSTSDTLNERMVCMSQLVKCAKIKDGEYPKFTHFILKCSPEK